MAASEQFDVMFTDELSSADVGDTDEDEEEDDDVEVEMGEDDDEAPVGPVPFTFDSVR